MKKYIGILAIVALSLVSTTDFASAAATATVNSSATIDVSPVRVNGTGEVKAKRAEDKSQLQDERTDFRAGMEVKRGAVKDAPAGERPEMRDELKNDRDEFKGGIQDERQGMMLDLRGMIATNLLRRADNHMQISARVKTRIAKIKSEGKIDTSAATALVLQADASIEIAKTTAMKVKADVDAKMSGEIVKSDIQATIAALKEANHYLQQAVDDLKAKSGTMKPKVNTEVNTNTSVDLNTSNTQ